MCSEDLGVKISSNLKLSQQSRDAANKVNRMLVFTKRNFSFKDKDEILPLYNSWVRPYFEYIVQFSSLHLAKVIAKADPTRSILLRNIPYLYNIIDSEGTVLRNNIELCKEKNIAQ